MEESLKDKILQRRKQKRRTCLLISGAAGLLILITLFTLGGIYNKIFDNVWIASRTDVSNLTQKEAEDLLYEEYKDADPVVTINYKDQQIQLPFGTFGEYDYATTASVAFAYGRDLSFLSKTYAYLTGFIKKDFPFTIYMNEDYINERLSQVVQLDMDGYKDTSYEIIDDVLYITAGRSGDYYDFESIKVQIADAMKVVENVEINANIINNKAYQGVNIDKVYDMVCAEPKDAYYDEKAGKIVTHTVGYSFDKGQARLLTDTLAENETCEIPLTAILPEITEEKLTEKMFGDTLSSYSTKYNKKEIDRSYNLLLASNKVNGTVIPSGGVFSYNDVVGPRTVAAGYRNAKIFENGRIVDGLAGGICQVSTTIYNAALYANLEITEKKNHSFPVVYAPMGQDATVVMGSIDFKFTNNTSHPIKVVSSVTDGICKVSILGTKQQDFKVEIINTILSSRPFATNYVQDDTLAYGEERVLQSGQAGYTVSSVRNVYLNGQRIAQDKLPSSYYSVRNAEIARNQNAVPPETDEPLAPTDAPAEIPTEAPLSENPQTDTNETASEQQ